LLRINPESEAVRQLKAEALRSLGSRQIAATARNYYLTQAQEVEKKLHIGMMKIKDKDIVQNVTLAGIFEGMAVKLDPVKSADVKIVAGFRNPAVALVKDVDKEGGTLKIIKFLSMFRSDD